MVKWIALFIVVFSIFPVGFAEPTKASTEIGWFWNGKVDEKKNVKKEKKVGSIDISDDEIDEKFSLVQKKIKMAMRKAYLFPTPENLHQYKILQDQTTEQANQFSNAWQDMLLQHPENNYALTHPTNGVGLQIYHEKEAINKDKIITQFAQTSGLFFFYRSTCTYCQRFAPILKSFSVRFNIAIIPITLDGISLPDFPGSQTDHGQAKQFHVKVEPSLFAVNPYTQKAYPIAYGLVSEAELRDNIYNIMTHYQENAK